MNANDPVTLRLPDGTEREVRRTPGASRLIRKAGITISTEMQDDQLAECIYYMMYDDEGNPPDISLDKWMFMSIDPDRLKEIGAAFIAAMSGIEKKIALDRINAATPSLEEITGSVGMPSPPSVSDSAETNSGGDIPSQNSKPSPNAGEIAKISQTTEPELSQPA